MQRTSYYDKIISTADGSLTLYSQEYKEAYHSIGGAFSEAQSLYIEGSHLQRILEENSAQKDLCVLDVGLGLAYNACTTIDCWMKSETQKNLRIHSLEKSIDLIMDISSGHASWQKNTPKAWLEFCQSQQKMITGDFWSCTLQHPKQNKQCTWSIQHIDASQEKIKGCQEQEFIADFIWQDPFSPKNNPEMWSSQWFTKLYKMSRPGTKLLSYSVARVVKNALDSAGWSWKRIKGRGSKKDWLLAEKLD